MIVKIGTPCYYTKHYEVEDELISFCDKISKFYVDREYSENLKVFEIEPVVAPMGVLAEGLWAEEIMYSKSIKRITIYKHIDYEEYLSANVKQKMELTVNCVLRASHEVAKKKALKFDNKQFSSDLLAYVNTLI